VIAGRWTASHKRAIVESRLNLTRAIAAAITGSSSRLAVLISASAVGYYGDRGDETVEDDAPAGNDFLATLCPDWEASALEAQKYGTRVFLPRIGIVLGPEEGALARIVLPFRFGAGGPIGSGRHYVPWIQIDDLVEVLVSALQDECYSGPLIAAAPNPVTSRQLARAIGVVLHRLSVLPVPGIALRILLGEAGAYLLTGQRVRPRRLEQLGFVWRYSEIETVLADILKDNDIRIERFNEFATKPLAGAASNYLSIRRPRFVLSHKISVEAPIEEVFRFLAKPQNLGVMTREPCGLRFSARCPMNSPRLADRVFATPGTLSASMADPY
jgi:uncharacterized protein (TIGR01777 family)